MKTYKQIISEVAPAVSPADKEFVAMHPVTKKQFVRWPENQFKGGTAKDHSKLAKPDPNGEMQAQADREKPNVSESFRALEESKKNPKDHGGGYVGVNDNEKNKESGHIEYALMTAKHMRHHGLDSNKLDGVYGNSSTIKHAASGKRFSVYQRDYDAKRKVYHVSVRGQGHDDADATKALAKHLSDA